MSELEVRTYSLSGELTADQWDLLHRQLGATGLTLHTLADTPEAAAPDELPELATPPEPLTADRSDLLRFANNEGINWTLAGRAWSVLTRIYDYKVNREEWLRYPWAFEEDLEQYARSPILFHVVPKPWHEEDEFHHRWQEKVAQLDVRSLDQQVSIIRSAIQRRGGDTRVIGEHLGRLAGPKTLDLLEKFVAWKLAGDTTQQDA